VKPERWGSPLVQEKYQGEKAWHNIKNNNINYYYFCTILEVITSSIKEQK
jgi:hypothetical protein